MILCFRVIPCIFHISMSIIDHGSGIATLSMKFRSFWWYYHRKWMEFDHSCAHVKFGYFFIAEKHIMVNYSIDHGKLLVEGW